MLTPDEYFQVLTYIVATAAAALVVACCVAMIVWLWQETQGKD